MCLATRRIFPNIALRDKVVYKILRRVDDGLYTPYVYEKITRREINARGDKTISTWNADAVISFKRHVGFGYVHAYKNFTDAQNIIAGWLYKPENNLVVKCIIPAGTLYFNSSDGREICAKQMIISELEWNALNKK